MVPEVKDNGFLRMSFILNHKHSTQNCQASKDIFYNNMKDRDHNKQMEKTNQDETGTVWWEGNFTDTYIPAYTQTIIDIFKKIKESVATMTQE